MVQPNIVIESKGRYIFQRLISKTDSSGLKNTEIDRLDDSKTVVKPMTAPADQIPSSITYYGMIYNDEDDDDTWILKIKQGRLNSSWVISVEIDDVLKVDGDEISTTSFQMHIVKITLTRSLNTAPPADPPLIDGECCFAIIQMYPKSTGDVLADQDCIKTVGVLPIVYLDDIELNMEQLIEDEIIFPEDADKLSDEVIEEFIHNRTTEVLEWLIRRLNSITIPDYEYVRRFIINRVKKDCYQRFIDYSISGGQEFMANIQELKVEAVEILKNIQADGDIDW